MTPWEQLAGNIELTPGRLPRNIFRKRPLHLPSLLAGRPADTLPQLLGSLFTLCGYAHQLTARAALMAARGFEFVPKARDMLELRLHTARDHVRRILLDWPMESPTRHAASEALLSCPLFREPDAHTAMQALNFWVERHLLAMSGQEWIRRWAEDGESWLSDWCSRAPTPAAHALLAVGPHTQSFRVNAQPLRLHEDPVARRQLADLLAADAPDLDARLAPLAREAFSTGSWTRERQSLGWAGDSVWARYASRLVDLVQLSQSAEVSRDSWLCSGSSMVASGEGMAWTEIARGLLVHWVRLEGGKAASYHVVAPTDWNFHPEGPLAAALAGLSQDHSGVAGARWIAAAFDPCVPVVVQMHPEYCDA